MGGAGKIIRGLACGFGGYAGLYHRQACTVKTYTDGSDQSQQVCSVFKISGQALVPRPHSTFNPTYKLFDCFYLISERAQ
mgnify:CR=1 FL=1